MALYMYMYVVLHYMSLTTGGGTETARAAAEKNRVWVSKLVYLYCICPDSLFREKCVCVCVGGGGGMVEPESNT